jgi:hypothetical protein
MERRKVVVGGVGKCCRGQSVCGDIRHMVTPALALTSVNNINLEVLRKRYWPAWIDEHTKPRRHSPQRTISCRLVNPDPVKVEGFRTDTTRIDCVRLKQVGRLGLQPRKTLPLRCQQSCHGQSLSKAAEKAKSHLGPYGKPQNLGGLLLSFCRVSTETLKQKQTGVLFQVWDSFDLLPEACRQLCCYENGSLIVA